MGVKFRTSIKIILIKDKGLFLIQELLIFMPLMKFISKYFLNLRPIMQAIKGSLDDQILKQQYSDNCYYLYD